MITGFFLQVLSSFLGFLVSFLPIASLPPGISSSVSYMVGVLNVFNYILPIDVLFTLVTYGLAFELAFWLWSLTKWVIRLLRGH